MAAGYKDFTAGAILTAADLEDYNQNQSIMRFASAAARDSALTTVKTEGMMAYLIDVNTVTVYNGSAWSTIGPVHGAWVGFTPVITQNNAPTFTTNYARYMRVGRMVRAQYYLTLIGTGTAANGISVSLPITAAQNFLNIGTGIIFDTSGSATYPGHTVLSGTSQFVFRDSTSITASATGILGATGAVFAGALAVGDEVYATVEYEASADA